MPRPLTPALSPSDGERGIVGSGKDAFHRVPNPAQHKWDAVERVLTGFVAGVVVMVAASGCGTTRKQTESLLQQSGFKAMPVATPQQKEELATLPKGKISKVTQQQKVYYVYPDRSQKLLYVGKEEQYQLYQRILQDEQGFNKDKQAFEDSRALKDAYEGKINGWDLEW